MQKVLFVINHMNVGGIQKALLELLKALAKEGRYEVSLFCCKHEGAFLEKLPKQIILLPENPYARICEQPASACRQQGRRYYTLRVLLAVWSKCFGKAVPARLTCKLIGKLDGEYDVAISYSQPIEDHAFCNLTNEIALNCVKAKKRVTFVHCDFGSYGGNTKRNRRLYQKFDAIAAVSDSVGKRFAQIVPEVADRVYTVYNVCDREEIRRLAEDEPVAYEKPAVVTVARLSEEKGLARCVPVFARLQEAGVDAQWHIVGGGPMERALRQAIAEHGMEDTILLHGQQINPYRFVKNASFLLLPSYHEAAPLVFDEAMALDVPILSTNTLSAEEMVCRRGVGMVCENNEQALYDMLYRALTQGIQRTGAGAANADMCIRQFDAVCALKEM